MSDEVRVDANDGDGGEGPEFFDLEQAIGNIPISQQDYDMIIEHLSTEIVTAIEERSDLEKKWAKWRRQSEGRPEQEAKSYPWQGASNVTVPLTMENVNGIFALLKSTYEDKVPFWTVDDQNPEENGDKALQQLLNILAKSEDHLDLDNASSDILYDFTRMGTEFVHVPWVTDEYAFKAPDASGVVVTQNVIKRDSPVIRGLRIEDFITRPHWPDPQRAPWIAIKYPFFEYELVQKQAQGIFNDVDQVINRGPEAIDDELAERLQRAGVKTSGETGVFSLYMCHYYYDIDGDDVPEDLILWIDPIGKVCVRKELNTLGIRPVERMPYLNLPGQLYALGICHICEPMQDEVDTLHNMRVDGMHISLLQMYVTKKGSPVAPRTEFRPLKNIEVDDPSKDFQIVKFPDVGHSTLQGEMMAKEYANRATGKADAMMGFESKTSSARTTAAGTMFLADQGSKMFNAIRKQVDRSWSRIGQLVLYQLVRNKERVIERMVPLVEPELQGPLTELLNNIQLADIPARFKFHVEATPAEKSEEIQKQYKLTLVQLYTMYGKQILELAMLFGNPQIPEQAKATAMKLYTGATKLMDDVFKFFDTRDTKAYLPYVKDIELMMKMMEFQKDMQIGGMLNGMQGGGGGMGPGGGGSAGLGGPGGRPAMEGPGQVGGGSPGGIPPGAEGF